MKLMTRTAIFAVIIHRHYPSYSKDLRGTTRALRVRVDHLRLSVTLAGIREPAILEIRLFALLILGGI